MVPSRRSFFARAGAGFAGLALIDLLSRDGFFAPTGPSREPARRGAKHCVFLFMNGAPSQVDTFDPKPALTRYHNQPYRGDTPIGSNGRPVGNLMSQVWPIGARNQRPLPAHVPVCR